MAEELPEITDEKIEKAALPEGKRANEEVSEESTFIELEGKDLDGLPPIEEEEVTEDFETSKHVEKQAEEIENEAEKRAKLAQNRIDKAVKQAKDYQRRELQALQYAKQIAEENKKLKDQQTQMSNSYGEIVKNYDGLDKPKRDENYHRKEFTQKENEKLNEIFRELDDVDEEDPTIH